MDFFSHQDVAKKKSLIFFLAFSMAVFFAVSILYFAITSCIGIIYFNLAHTYNGPWPLPELIYGRPNAILAWAPFLKITSVLFLLIFALSQRRSSAIKKGGSEFIAELIGGEELEEAQNQKEKNFINIVDEMSLASGLPHPKLYILRHEQSINAVTAGLNEDDAIIAITQGSLQYLERDELQAVIAHEYAHIANGDYALNVTMASWLYGLYYFSAKGRDLFKLGTSLGGRASAAPILLGFILWTGGSAGHFAAKLLEAAFSRQREYLADAYASQFTRNPKSLASALKKIAGLSLKGVLDSKEATAMSSFFIVSPLQAAGLLRTHPPIEKRILRLDSSWDGEITRFKPTLNTDDKEPHSQWQNNAALFEFMPNSSESNANLLKGKIPPQVWGAALAAIVAGGTEKATQPNASGGEENEVKSALDSLYNLPEDMQEAIKQNKLLSILLSPLLSDDEKNLSKQKALITHYYTKEIFDKSLTFKKTINYDMKYDILSFTIPKLNNLPTEEKRRFNNFSSYFFKDYDCLEMIELAAYCLIKKHLGKIRVNADYSSFNNEFKEDIVKLLWFTAISSCEDEKIIRQAFAAGAVHFKELGPISPVLKERVDCKTMVEAMERLIYTNTEIRQNILLAAISVVTYDKLVTEREYDIICSLAVAFELPRPKLELKQDSCL